MVEKSILLGYAINAFDIVACICFSLLIINRLYIKKKFNKKDHFDFYNDLFSWEMFFFMVGILSIIQIADSVVFSNITYHYWLVKIQIIILLDAYSMKIIHLEKIMKVITYERHYFTGIISFPIFILILVINFRIETLIYIFLGGGLGVFLLFFIFFKNTATTKLNLVKICIGGTAIGIGMVLSALIEDFNFYSGILNAIGIFLIFDSFRKEF